MESAPKSVWLIFDPCDGPHLFRSQEDAEEMMKKWEKEAQGKNYDSYWDMVGPIRYDIA
jgi:hypothetical protein